MVNIVLDKETERILNKKIKKTNKDDLSSNSDIKTTSTPPNNIKY